MSDAAALPPDILARYNDEVADAMISMHREMSGGLVQYLGIELVRFDAGRLWCTAELAESLVTPSGNVHGGALAAILDHITGAVIYPLIEPGWWGATTDLKLNYVAAVRPGRVEAESTVVAMSKRSAVVRGEIYTDGRVACAAQGTITLVPPRAT